MYTRCPRCHTIFSLSEAERTARGGLVRCGRCATVFQSNEALLPALPLENEVLGGGPDTHDISNAAGFTPSETSSSTEFAEFPLLGRARRPRTRTPFWILGNLLLLLLLGAQGLYFFGTDLSRWYPWIGQVATDARHWLGLPTAVRTDAGSIDLERARIALHPNIANALRVTATLVNRAERTQPFPLLEVTFSNSGGNIIARRVFRAREYLGQARSSAGMPPNVAIPVSFDVLNPGNGAVGYEIQVFAASR